MRRRIEPSEAMDLIRSYVAGDDLSLAEKRYAVRFGLEEFASRHPGRSVEIRIPWVGAVQAIAGPVHTRGTPSNVVEMDPDTFMKLAVGIDVDTSAISYSGTRADLSGYFPLFGPTELGS